MLFICANLRAFSNFPDPSSPPPFLIFFWKVALPKKKTSSLISVEELPFSAGVKSAFRAPTLPFPHSAFASSRSELFSRTKLGKTQTGEIENKRNSFPSSESPSAHTGTWTTSASNPLSRKRKKHFYQFIFFKKNVKYGNTVNISDFFLKKNPGNAFVFLVNFSAAARLNVAFARVEGWVWVGSNFPVQQPLPAKKKKKINSRRPSFSRLKVWRLRLRIGRKKETFFKKALFLRGMYCPFGKAKFFSRKSRRWPFFPLLARREKKSISQTEKSGIFLFFNKLESQLAPS